jgi:aminopeptidase N
MASLARAYVSTGYEALLGVPYALAKLDLVGVPDFAAGAMENWGLVTFREVDLLVPPEATGPSGDAAAGGAGVQQLYRVPTVVAHELAHMWFGARCRGHERFAGPLDCELHRQLW